MVFKSLCLVLMPYVCRTVIRRCFKVAEKYLRRSCVSGPLGSSCQTMDAIAYDSSSAFAQCLASSCVYYRLSTKMESRQSLAYNMQS
jgi:uncharacterized membrane protein